MLLVRREAIAVNISSALEVGILSPRDIPPHQTVLVPRTWWLYPVSVPCQRLASVIPLGSSWGRGEICLLGFNGRSPWDHCPTYHRGSVGSFFGGGDGIYRPWVVGARADQVPMQYPFWAGSPFRAKDVHGLVRSGLSLDHVRSGLPTVT